VIIDCRGRRCPLPIIDLARAISDTPIGATITVDRFTPLAGDPPETVEAIVGEGLGLLAFMAPDAASHRVRFIPEVA